eukprot:TRINITY_DN73428_c0_g1_i1.p1 TRINITY_DN73428_c0_g1~~TRINITY_DN73428_c0_g1_i1.p1  ORF type:complete len:464 (-),score=65.27 TRINITY_DN73428_c0_g1_i1:251-1642(-)
MAGHSSCFPCAMISGCRICSMLALVRSHPRLINRAVISQPQKLFALLARGDALAIRSLSDELPSNTLNRVVSALFTEISYSQFDSVIVPLMSDCKLASKLAPLLALLEVDTIVEVASRTQVKNLEAVLGASSDALMSLISAVEPGKVACTIIPILQEPVTLLELTLVPLLEQVSQHERLAMVVNHADAQVLLWLLRGTEARQMADVLNELADEDFQPNGAVHLLLQELADDRFLVQDMILPLLRQSEPQKIARLVQGVEASKLLLVLRSVDIEGVIRLLEHTNADLVVRLFQGPLESVLARVAGGVAGVIQKPVIASLVKESTDQLEEGLSKAEAFITRGQLARGAQRWEGYKLTDFTRGLIATAEDDIRDIARIGKKKRGAGGGDSALTVEDYARGLLEIEKGHVKDSLRSVQDGWEAIMQNIRKLTEIATSSVTQQSEIVEDSPQPNGKISDTSSCSSSTG